ncbi:hypothetical protein SAMN02745121_08892 [Nannocystis exedens]|uniref:Uncharacterized protein n=1 Tax=Nannocystis exedens TaxID=54 RepID=A0A1I2IQ72_9BACT|nr:hypothetical protein [Nannocystis exedens]PCC69285.1 hypothetical protein NAEX_02307 [Nannocystis exedens]SFF44455.1 hypothetical protein SAMN02745121_08892 [Nannocystis exedens]
MNFGGIEGLHGIDLRPELRLLAEALDGDRIAVVIDVQHRPWWASIASTEGVELFAEAEAIEEPHERGIAAEKILRALEDRLREKLR